MRHRPGRVACVAIALAALMALIACMGPIKQHRLKPSQILQLQNERIIGLTTVNGQEIEFDSIGGSFANGSVRGKVNGAEYAIAIEQVQRVWVMRKSVSAGRTVALVVGITVGTVVVVAGVALIAFAASGGCPFAYSWDGEQYTFDAELYGGAISRGLERQDYSELSRLRAKDGSYRILVANELEEIDFTDKLELWSVDHATGSRVGVDSEGKLYEMAAPRPPVEARDENGADLRPWLEAADRRIWEAPPAELPGGRLRHEIVMTFDKPAGAKTARLYAHAGSGEWGIRMLSTLFELYGTGIETRMAEVDRDSSAVQSIRDWSTREDLYTLKVWVEEPSGWEVRGYLPGGGMGGRVVPLDVSHVVGDRLRIRLQPPAGFWAINSVAVDYSAGGPVKLTRLRPTSAVDRAGISVVRKLREDDGTYYEAARGERVEVRFAAPAERAGMSRTVFLASKGYYRPTIRSSGPPDTATLFEIFTTPDGMARLAARRYATSRAMAGRTN
jgi:hypothetical protein